MNDAFDCIDQEHANTLPCTSVTESETVEAAAETLNVVGVTAYVHVPGGMLPACVTVIVMFAAVTDRTRSTRPAFSETQTTTRVVFPTGVIETTRITDGSRTPADHWQFSGVPVVIVRSKATVCDADEIVKPLGFAAYVQAPGRSG